MYIKYLSSSMNKETIFFKKMLFSCGLMSIW